MFPILRQLFYRIPDWISHKISPKTPTFPHLCFCDARFWKNPKKNVKEKEDIPTSYCWRIILDISFGCQARGRSSFCRSRLGRVVFMGCTSHEIWTHFSADSRNFLRISQIRKLRGQSDLFMNFSQNFQDLRLRKGSHFRPPKRFTQLVRQPDIQPDALEDLALKLAALTVAVQPTILAMAPGDFSLARPSWGSRSSLRLFFLFLYAFFQKSYVYAYTYLCKYAFENLTGEVHDNAHFPLTILSHFAKNAPRNC